MLGERYDFILNATQSEEAYWIKAKGFADCSVYKVFETALLLYNPSNITNLINNTFNYDNMDRKGIVNKIFF